MLSQYPIGSYVDVGTNFGSFASGVQIPDDCKLLIEPNPDLSDSINQLNPNAFVLNAAVSQFDGTIYLNRVPGNTGLSYISTSPESENHLIVPCFSISSLSSRHSSFFRDGSFIKIDTEGYEYSILKQFTCMPRFDRYFFGFESLSITQTRECLSLFNSPSHKFFYCHPSFYNSSSQRISFSSFFDSLISGRCRINVYELTPESVEYSFYSMIFCVPRFFL